MQQARGSGMQQARGSGMQQARGSGVQQAVKADVVFVSKSQFKVLSAYDAQLVSIFKRVPSRIYGEWRRQMGVVLCDDCV